MIRARKEIRTPESTKEVGFASYSSFSDSSSDVVTPRSSSDSGYAFIHFVLLMYRVYIIGSKLFLSLLICEWQRVFCNTKEYDNLRSVFSVFSAM